ncbi:hypothetical protein Adi01nite_70860 [Amorphoplanes digitatis]|nr:hypothetical protein GCM10020092_032830 [Actinoplanes digitatis]GID97674.1 hypothetical protein Adi01nite_70860 [Actinoplanes digitatis]
MPVPPPWRTALVTSSCNAMTKSSASSTDSPAALTAALTACRSEVTLDSVKHRCSSTSCPAFAGPGLAGPPSPSRDLYVMRLHATRLAVSETLAQWQPPGEQSGHSGPTY